MQTDSSDHEDRSAPGRRDADLAIAAAAGDREALGEIYDRYAPRIHSLAVRLLRDHDAAADITQETFLAAAQRLDGLREPERLRSWLFAVARHEVVNHVRRASRAVVTDAIEDFETPVETTEGFDGVRGEELRLLMADTRAGLDDRDRLVLELAYGEELSGSGIAAALGVQEDNAHQLLSRARQRLRTSLGALLVARRGRGECAELDRTLRSWDGTFSTVWRKRVARHVDGCADCGDLERRALSPAALGTAFPLVLLPADLRDRLLERVDLMRSGASPIDIAEPWPDDGFPPSDELHMAVLATSVPSQTGVHRGLRSTAAAALALGIALVLGFALAVGFTIGPKPPQVQATAETVGDEFVARASGSPTDDQTAPGQPSPSGTATSVTATASPAAPVSPTEAPETSVTETADPTTAEPTPDPPAAPLRLIIRPGGDGSAVSLGTATRSSVTLTVAHTGDDPIDVTIDASPGLVVTPDAVVVPTGRPFGVQVRWRTPPAPGELTFRSDGAQAVTVRIVPAEAPPPAPTSTLSLIAPKAAVYLQFKLGRLMRTVCPTVRSPSTCTRSPRAWTSRPTGCCGRTSACRTAGSWSWCSSARTHRLAHAGRTAGAHRTVHEPDGRRARRRRPARGLT